MDIFYSFMESVRKGFSVTPSTLYEKNSDYGFVTEETLKKYKALRYPELTSGFEIPYWFMGEKLTDIVQDQHGCRVKNPLVPLCFQANVPCHGNYLAEVVLYNAGDDPSSYILFSGRRRIARSGNIESHAQAVITLTINVSDIIPRGQSERFSDSSINLSLLGSSIYLQSIHIQSLDVPTIYLAGDSTVTDQTGDYPYHMEQCYCGWGQAFTLYLDNSLALANHAHSGLTTESFREEGHHAIVMEELKPGDYFFMQFAHNDQKLPHLLANDGYRKNILRYIKEVRDKKAFPVIVTPLGRNTWKGLEKTYNDLLIDYANVCLEIGKEENIPVIDLHAASTAWIIEHGLEDARRFFYPGDYTHTNDYGAILMAGFVAKEVKKLAEFPGYEKLAAAIISNDVTFIPPLQIHAATPPEGFVDDRPKQSGPAFLPSVENPDDIADRSFALSLLIQAVHFFPTNVYNDMFTDVIGHEWYAGSVECAYQNGMIDPHLISDSCFFPTKAITLEEYLSMAVNAYSSRKALPDADTSVQNRNWTDVYWRTAVSLGLITEDSDRKKLMTREEARLIAEAVNKLI